MLTKSHAADNNDSPTVAGATVFASEAVGLAIEVLGLLKLQYQHEGVLSLQVFDLLQSALVALEKHPSVTIVVLEETEDLPF